MPEVNFFGQIVGAEGFGVRPVWAKWNVLFGDENWRLIRGVDSGQTWVAIRDEETEPAVFSHPIDIKLACSGLKGWPKLYVQVEQQDYYGRNELGGYGFCHLPTTPGTHRVEIAVWRPKGSLGQSISAFFTGGNPRLENSAVVMSSKPRFPHEAVSTGTVTVELTVITKGFESFNVEM